MLNRNALLLVAGAAIFALDASAASAQDTTRTRRPTSSRRIPITKEAPGEVVTPRIDTVQVYRTDTLRLPGRVDTVVTTNTVTRVDTLNIPVPQVLREIGGFYLGLGGGSSLPAANFNDGSKPGWMGQAMIGVDPIGSLLGLRLTGAYSHYGEHSWAENRGLDDASLMTAALDAKLRLGTVNPFNRRVQFYLIGGGTWNHFKNVIENNGGTLSVGNRIGVNGQLPTTFDSDWHSGWGYNAGGGGEIGFGRTNLFMETRFSRFKGENSNISHVPLVIGLSWF